MPDGKAPTSLLRARFGAQRVACVGGPSHAQEMVHAGAGLVAAAFDESLAESLAAIFTRSGWSASSRTTLSASSSRASRKTPPRSPRVRPRRRG